MSRALPIAVAAAFLCAAAPAMAQTLTRIETKPFYGAVVTIEEGVRVFRPLPPTGNMIINPDGRTPLNISINEVREVPAGGAGYPVTGGYDNGGGASGLYLNPWARFGKHGHHGRFGHAGKGKRYVTHVGARRVAGPGHKGGGGGKGGGGH